VNIEGVHFVFVQAMMMKVGWWDGTWLEHRAQKIRPQARQWCLRLNSVKATLHSKHYARLHRAGHALVCAKAQNTRMHKVTRSKFMYIILEIILFRMSWIELNNYLAHGLVVHPNRPTLVRPDIMVNARKR
jgi:hypothetical protein